MRPLVIYHANCADGFGAAFVTWKAFGVAAEYLPMHYMDNNKPPEEQWDEFISRVPDFDGREIYVLDFSLPRVVMGRLIDAAEVVWLDHHRTAFEMWRGEWTPGDTYLCYESRSFIKLDSNRSGALITWEYFNRGEAPPLWVRHIDDYDRWQFEIAGTRAFMKRLWLEAPWHFEQWDKLFLAFNEVRHACRRFIEEGNVLLRDHRSRVNRAVEKGRDCIIRLPDGRSVSGVVVNCLPETISDVGHELAARSGTFGLCWYLDGKAVKCSLRSSGDYDVSGIARQFGGGGHTNAAGFSTTLERLKEWLLD